MKNNPLEYVVSSNTYGPDNLGYLEIDSTGMNTGYIVGDVGDCNGPGPDNGPPFNRDETVVQWRNYVLYVS